MAWLRPNSHGIARRATTDRAQIFIITWLTVDNSKLIVINDQEYKPVTKCHGFNG